MKSIRYEAAVLAAIFLALACIASAQFSSSESIVYMGDLSFLASSHSSERAKEASSEAAVDAAASANNTTQNGTAIDNLTMNIAPEGERTPIRLGAAKSVDSAESSGKGVLDLSGYAKSRAKGNLTGYTNIIYPIAGARGTSTSTTSGGGCCG